MSLLKKLLEESGYQYDDQLNILYGEKLGYKFAVQDHGQNQFRMLFSVKNTQIAIDKMNAKEISKYSPVISTASFKNYKLTCTIKPGFTKGSTGKNILQAIDDATEYLSSQGFEQCCEATGETEGVDLYIVGQQLSFLNPESFSQRSQELDYSEQVTLQTTENVFLGMLGAFLGSLVGVLAIVIIGQLGYVAFVSGIVMGVATIKGYELFARRLSKKGAVISIIIILLMTYFANQLDWAISIIRVYDVSIFDAFLAVNSLVAEGIIETSSYIMNLVMVYIFTVIAAIVVIVNAINASKTKFEIRKLQ